MRRIVSVLAALAVSAPVLAQQVQPEVFTLDNGMKFLLLQRTDQPNVIAAGWVAKVGSVNERPGITGISHFFEHMMFKGTDTIGTSSPDADARYRDAQKALRARMNDITWSEQYRRFFNGEINDPWNPANDTPELAKLRAELKALMDSQQGRLGADRIAELTSKLSSAGADEKAKVEAEIALLKAEQEKARSIVKDEFDKIYTGQGGSGMNAFTSHDLTFYFINVPSNKFELWAWMESDRLSDSVFREFYSERDVVHEERRLRTESTPTGIFQEQFESMFWTSSGYSWPVIGWSSDLNSYTMDEAMRYWNIYYRPNNLCGVIVGDFNPGEVKETITRYFSRLSRGEMNVPPVVTLEVGQTAEMRMNAECDCQPSVEVRYHTVPFRHKDAYALDVLSSVLNGRTGRLYKSMVEGSETASDASARQDSRKYAGAFSFNAEVKGDSTPADLEKAWYAEIEKLKNEPVPALELQKVKNQFAASNYRRLKTNFFLLLQLGYYEGLGTWEEINESPKKIDEVTADDIQRVAKTYFTEKNRSVATYTRKAGAETAAEDPALAGLPAPMQAQARQIAAQIAKATDLAQLKANLEQMMAQAAQVPPQMKPMIDFIVAKVNARIAELEKSPEASKN
ncbi:MAG: pitrilysin family protein [Planctomycetota bacterium]|nr:pitrilysin family protein [Planctomycetota bacterium]